MLAVPISDEWYDTDVMCYLESGFQFSSIGAQRDQQFLKPRDDGVTVLHGAVYHKDSVENSTARCSLGRPNVRIEWSAHDARNYGV